MVVSPIAGPTAEQDGLEASQLLERVIGKHVAGADEPVRPRSKSVVSRTTPVAATTFRASLQTPADPVPADDRHAVTAHCCVFRLSSWRCPLVCLSVESARLSTGLSWSRRLKMPAPVSGNEKPPTKWTVEQARAEVRGA